MEIQNDDDQETEYMTEHTSTSFPLPLLADAPYFQPDAFERGAFALTRPRRAQRLVLEGRTARRRAIAEGVVEIQPVMAITASRLVQCSRIGRGYAPATEGDIFGLA